MADSNSQVPCQAAVDQVKDGGRRQVLTAATPPTTGGGHVAYTVPIRLSAQLKKQPGRPQLASLFPPRSSPSWLPPSSLLGQLLFMPSLSRPSYILGFHPPSDGRHLYCVFKRPWRRRRVFSRRRRIAAKT